MGERSRSRTAGRLRAVLLRPFRRRTERPDVTEEEHRLRREMSSRRRRYDPDPPWMS
ncbi:MAG TPA: hypothetical protein VF058_11410 [Actinomycetota bacterium]